MLINPTLKTRIILTFPIITVVFVGVISMVSYYSVKNIYMNQISEQTQLLTRLIGSNLNTKYLSFLASGDKKSLTNKYYYEYLKKQSQSMQLNQTFIFDGDFNVLAHSDSLFILGRKEPRLYLSRLEITNLPIAQSSLSLPFKGNDDNWYLWGFYRLDENHWLSIQESAARLEKIEELAKIFWLIGLTGALITILTGWFLARSITKPIDRLVKFSNELGRGRFDIDTPTSVKGELAALSRAMDKMRKDIARKQKEKEEILAQIAHEIRNPLGGIELLTGLIHEDVSLKPESKKYAEQILGEIGGLKHLISEFLNYSKPLMAKPEWVSLPDIISETSELMQSEIKAKNFEINHNGDLGKIWFDPQHIRQVFMNLISNSITAANSGGSLSISRISNKTSDIIRIHDDGPGIPEENLPKIFEPFFTTNKNGTGLGLAICKKLCQENQADISAINNAGNGCIFTISIRNEMN